MSTFVPFVAFVGVCVHAYLCFGHMCMYTHTCGGLGLSLVVFFEPSDAYAFKQYLLPSLMFPVLISLTCSGDLHFFFLYLLGFTITGDGQVYLHL